jgi:hypothetical protein
MFWNAYFYIFLYFEKAKTAFGDRQPASFARLRQAKLAFKKMREEKGRKMGNKCL